MPTVQSKAVPAQAETVVSNKKSRLVEEIFRQADAVCFDFDSTLIRYEGIDQLAAKCGVGEVVAKLTSQAMGGTMSFRESLKQRLDIVKPSQEKIGELVSEHVGDVDSLLTPGVRELVATLLERDVSVFIISGGFKQLIEPVARCLGIPCSNVYANELFHNPQGEYIGFDETAYTSRTNGKARAVEEVKKNHQTVAMIGDGMTDYEACPPADLFVGFGGNKMRQNVKEVAKWYIYDMKCLTDVLTSDQNPAKKQPVSFTATVTS